MAAGKWKVYDQAKKFLADSTHDLDRDTWKLALFTSSSNANDLTLDPCRYADLTGEVANANGYTTGGVNLSGQTWTVSGGTTTFDIGDGSWTAAGGSITARFAVLYYNATHNGIAKPLLAVCLLDTTPADVTATDTNTFTIQMNAAGVLTLSGAAVD